ncbi:MAG: hypothetical protein AAGE43_03885 [Pseudomonadota bacterium]
MLALSGWLLAILAGGFVLHVGLRGLFQTIRGREFELTQLQGGVRLKTKIASVRISQDRIEVQSSEAGARQIPVEDGTVLIDYDVAHRWAVFQESLVSGVSPVDMTRPFRDVDVVGSLSFVSGTERVQFFRCVQYQPRWAFFDGYLNTERKVMAKFGAGIDIHEYVAQCAHDLMRAITSVGVEVRMIDAHKR